MPFLTVMCPSPKALTSATRALQGCLLRQTFHKNKYIFGCFYEPVWSLLSKQKMYFFPSLFSYLPALIYVQVIPYLIAMQNVRASSMLDCQDMAATSNFSPNQLPHV